MAECFACGTMLFNINLPCPKCGYIFDTDTNQVCPNKNVTICELTGDSCTCEGMSYGQCPIKNEAEKQLDY